jgi:hypothetical protein
LVLLAPEYLSSWKQDVSRLYNYAFLVNISTDAAVKECRQFVGYAWPSIHFCCTLAQLKGVK